MKTAEARARDFIEAGDNLLPNVRVLLEATLKQAEREAVERFREAAAREMEGLCERATDKWGSGEYGSGLANGYDFAADTIRDLSWPPEEKGVPSVSVRKPQPGPETPTRQSTCSDRPRPDQ